VAQHVPWAELGTGRVQVEFGRAGAAEDDAPEADPDDDGGEQ
jgi:ribosome maturation factor RimP